MNPDMRTSRLSANGKQRRGFAAMSPEKQRQIAQKGGLVAHQKGVAHEYTREEAQAAGKRGGKAVSRDRAHMARIGSKGGKASHRRKQQSVSTPSRGD